MALSEAYANSVSISTTEISLISGTSSLQTVTDDGIYQAFLDLNALAVGDIFLLRLYEKVQSSSTKRIVRTWTLAHAQSDPVTATDAFQLLHGWDMTLQKQAGTDRTIEWSIRKVA